MSLLPAEIRLLLQRGQHSQALHILTNAARTAKQAGQEHARLLEVLLGIGRRREAKLELQNALRLARESGESADALGFFARQLDLHDVSLSLYREAVRLAPGDPRLWYNLATSERTLGNLEAASDACAMALRLDPEMRPAVLLRSELVRATPDRNHVDDLRRRIARSDQSADAMFLVYALGKELHELGDYDAAFAAFARGAELRRRQLRYDVASDEHKIDRIIASFGQRGPAGNNSTQRHIFIIGLPRSGTTLTERILGGLPGVISNNETNNLSDALMRCTPAGDGDIFARAARADPDQVAQAYEDLAIPEEFTGSIIEKLPFNYLYVGSIARAFPQTPIVWLRRNALDSCFAMFRTLFGAAYPFSYDFGDLARYYAAYRRLQDHWASVFEDRITWVDYEELVSRPHEVGSSLAQACGLEWQESATDISGNRSASLTASAAQVRSGIYGSSVEIWRKYERHLAPLRDQLAAHGVEA